MQCCFLVLQNNYRLLTSTSHLFFLKKLSTIGVHFRCVKCYNRSFIVLLSVRELQKSKSDGSNYGMAIGLTKILYISRNLPSLILHLMIGYQSLHIGHSWKTNVLRSLIVFFHLHFNCHRMYLLSSSVSKPGSLRLSIQYSTVNSKAGRSRKTTLEMSNLTLILLWNAYCTCII